MVSSASPQPILHGIQDASGVAVAPEPLAIPQHLPWVFFLAERGPLNDVLTGGAAMTSMYGAKTFDERSAYFNHASLMAKTINANGNLVMARRLVAPDAEQARVRLSLEVVDSDVTVWERNADGSFQLDQDGNKIDSGNTAPGIRMRWLLQDIASMNDFGQGVKQAGSLTDTSGENTSTVFPIRDFAASHIGEYGNNIGFRLWAATTDSNQPVDDDVVYDQEAFLQRLQYVERPDVKSAAVVQQTIGGAQYVEFAFKDGVINKKVDTELSHDAIIEDEYRNVDPTSGFAPIHGPVDQFHLYKANLEEALGLMAQATGSTEDVYMMNAISAVDVDGIPYENIELVGPEEDGILLTEFTTHYLRAGSDGDLSLANFDTMVGNTVANFEDDMYDVMDSAGFPASAIWDSGYSIETKKKLLTPIGLRKDMYVILSTQDATLGRLNTATEETSMAVALRSAARLYPESFLYGTHVCRAAIVGHGGTMVNSKYTGITPMTIDLADKISKYAGGANGILNSRWGWNQDGNNRVETIKDVNNTFKKQIVRQKDWSNGLIWVQKYDMQSLFYPALQTVYDDDTSVLNSLINMIIMVECQKVAERVWRDLSGKNLTPAVLIRESNRLIEEYTAGRFDDLVVIQPDTFLTANDSKRGYSWSCNINVLAANMVTVGQFTVVARRRGDDE